MRYDWFCLHQSLNVILNPSFPCTQTFFVFLLHFSFDLFDLSVDLFEPPCLDIHCHDCCKPNIEMKNVSNDHKLCTDTNTPAIHLCVSLSLFPGCLSLSAISSGIIPFCYFSYFTEPVRSYCNCYVSFSSHKDNLSADLDGLQSTTFLLQI